jgi:biopolymer transport protein ExbB/TolQ
MELIARAMEEGGSFMWPILACAIVGAALTVERAITVFLRASIDAAAFGNEIQRRLLGGDTEAAIHLCNAEPGALLPRVVKAALLRADRPAAEARDAVEEATLDAAPAVTRRLSFLPMIANVSTLLGLLGTIQGLILAFEAVGVASAQERSAALSHGIAVAMYTTFAGLLVAIPVIVAHGVIAARANQVLDEIDHHALRVLNLLGALRDARPGGPAPGDLPGGDAPPDVPPGAPPGAPPRPRGRPVLPFPGA